MNKAIKLFLLAFSLNTLFFVSAYAGMGIFLHIHNYSGSAIYTSVTSTKCMSSMAFYNNRLILPMTKVKKYLETKDLAGESGCSVPYKKGPKFSIHIFKLNDGSTLYLGTLKFWTIYKYANAYYKLKFVNGHSTTSFKKSTKKNNMAYHATLSVF